MTATSAGQPSLRGEQTTLAASARRICGMVLRYWYVIRSSWPRTAELIYWPLVQMLMWGFLQSYLARPRASPAKAAGLFIGAVLLWDILVRSQLGFAVAFLEEIWSRNLGHLMMSPLRPAELVAALMVVSLIKLMVAMVPVALLAYFSSASTCCPRLRLRGLLRQPHLHELGARPGLHRRGAALGAGRGEFRLADRVRVPAAVLRLLSRLRPCPAWLQPVALALPPTYVFEGLRAHRPGGYLRGRLHAQGAAPSTSSTSPLGVGALPTSCRVRAARHACADGRMSAQYP